MNPANMTETSSPAQGEEDVFALQAAITKQQSHIKALKKGGASNKDVTGEVAILTELRAKLATLEAGPAAEPEAKFNRKAFDELILRKMYLVPSFEIHNGPAGLFDYGPMACVLKANVLATWRQHFTLEDNVLEIECTNLTPLNVLETSGHVERFTDLMVKDEITNECFRADKLLEDGIDKYLELPEHKHMPAAEVEAHRLVQRLAESYTPEELDEKLKLYNIKSPSNGVNNLTHPFPFNLMFKTTIGPEGNSVGFLRPETAQGMFLNFRRLLEYNQGKMPMAAAQIGLGFRNEIAPRNGLLRVREFCMAEIEHFCDPLDKSHAKFDKIAGTSMVLFPQEAQLGSGRTVTMTIGEAVAGGIVDNQTLGYYMARTQTFLERVGVNASKMRFRQHLKTEMAHYAQDCWDLEIKTCYGWVECVGMCCVVFCQLSSSFAVTSSSVVDQDMPIDQRTIWSTIPKRLASPLWQQDASPSPSLSTDKSLSLTRRPLDLFSREIRRRLSHSSREWTMLPLTRSRLSWKRMVMPVSCLAGSIRSHPTWYTLKLKRRIFQKLSIPRTLLSQHSVLAV